MKVLMFGWEFPPHISGGLGTACFGLTKALSSQDLEIIFVVPKAFGDEDQVGMQVIGANNVKIAVRKYRFKEEFKDINYVEIGSNLIPYVSSEEYFNILNGGETIVKMESYTDEYGKLNFEGGYGSNLLTDVWNYAIIAKSIAVKYEFDLIHSHDWLTYPAGIAAKEISGKPLVIHVHATEFDRSGVNVNQQVYDIERHGMHAANKIITVSNLTKNIVIHNYGVDSEKITTIYNAVEPVSEELVQEYKKAFTDKIVTFLGRITFQKGPEYFLEAAAKVLQKEKNVKFVMAGSGDLLEKMIRRAAELGITSKFHFTGFLKGDDVVKMLSISDAYVMPSVSEPFGISPLEAMRSNVPCIISKQSGVAEILKHAIKVDFWDVDAMADAIHGVIKYNGLKRTFKEYGKAEVDSLKWENAAVKVKEVYKESLIS
ncbi:MAG: glycosyltransferase family 4 protein [Bacteroidales bacterium]|nr:glycosyltransferase family 4 protein [Bacteroidales bacterium]